MKSIHSALRLNALLGGTGPEPTAITCFDLALSSNHCFPAPLICPVIRKIIKQPKAVTTGEKLNFPVLKYKYAVNPSSITIKTNKIILANFRVWFFIRLLPPISTSAAQRSN
jgi:hypothetical protein